MVFGVDFNADACAGARDNGFLVVRGDAMNLPLVDGSVDEIINCQFFNQQDQARVAQFLTEVRRVLKPGGRAILVWRNGAALIHVLAHALLTLLDRLQGHEVFPQYVHRLPEVERMARESGLTVEHRELANPLINWRSEHVGGVFGRLMGASCVLVLGRPAA